MPVYKDGCLSKSVAKLRNVVGIHAVTMGCLALPGFSQARRRGSQPSHRLALRRSRPEGNGVVARQRFRYRASQPSRDRHLPHRCRGRPVELLPRGVSLDRTFVKVPVLESTSTVQYLFAFAVQSGHDIGPFQGISVAT
jgi:hypothetical protein